MTAALGVQALATRERYRRLARHYDVTANLYYLIGYREWAFRKRAVAALELRPGDTVLDLCCGTGLNFALLREAVGDTGRVVGVDATDGILDQARIRIRNSGWANVDVVEADVARFGFPQGLAAILSTYALSMVPEYDAVVRRGAEALDDGGRFAVLDLTVPPRLRWLSRLYLLLTGAFGSTLEAADRDLPGALDRHVGPLRRERIFFGLTYLAWAEKRA